ncbi:MAG: LCP family protein [Phyllobacterium sp.]
MIDEPDVSADKPPAQRRRWVLWAFVIVTAIVLVAAASAYRVYARLAANIRHIEITSADLGENRPPKAPSGALNILVAGLDQESGKRAGLRDRSDTIMLVHLSFERNDAMVISFPRDLMVQLPGCRSREGLPGQRRHQGMINSSFNAGGIGCTWKTIETLTGIHIDHFVKIDFDGFRTIVDAVGGVELCIPSPIRDRYAPLNLPAGLQLLRGEQALGYVRVRHSLGDGTDIGRIQRQQDFLSAMAKKVLSNGTLANPMRLLRFLNAATGSVTTDPDLNADAIIDLAFQARRLSPSTISFLVTPWRYSKAYPGRVEWLERQARQLFRLVAADQPLNRSGPEQNRRTAAPEAKPRVPSDRLPAASSAHCAAE